MKQDRNSITFNGLGTIWIVELIDSVHFPTKLKNSILSEVQKFDNDYSRFKPSSYIGKLNIHKSILDPPEELIDMFSFAHKMFKVSQGVFNISVGGTLQRLRYGDTKTSRDVNLHFWDKVIYDNRSITIPIESAVDFGGFGKGWLLDKLAMLLENAGYLHYIINGGGDIVLSSDKPVELGLEHPYDSKKIIGTTLIQHGSLAVSSTVKRQWKIGHTTSHHIIDPITNDSSQTPIISTYVRGQTALITDTLATILLLRPEMKDEFEKYFNVQAILIHKDQISSTS